MSKANIVNIAQSSFSLSPPIMNHKSCDELGTYTPVTRNICEKHIRPQGKPSDKRTSIMQQVNCDQVNMM